MNIGIVITVVVGIWGFVLYRLFAGSKIEVETLLNPYHFVSIFSILGLMIFVVMLNFCVSNILLALGGGVACILYTCIPSGYNKEAIYIRGKKIPYEKIEDIAKEYIKDIVRMNIKYKHRLYYLDVKEGDEKILRDCEENYKKARKLK